jgi:hypothetical protein
VIVELLLEVLAVVEDSEAPDALVEVRLHIEAVQVDHIYTWLS